MSLLSGMTRPPVGFGPGSQTLEPGEEGLAYLPMPSGMRTYEPHLPDADACTAGCAGMALLERLHGELAGWSAGEERHLPLAGLDDPARALLAEVLGEGEVSVRVARPDGRIDIQEAALAGVWRVREHGADGAMLREALLVGAFPTVARVRAFPAAAEPRWPVAQEGVMNGPAILTELLDRSAACRPGVPAHAVNLSLLPHTPEDLAWLDEALGTGCTTVLSRGYGNCRVEATAQRHIWRVRYYNSVDTLILDTIEVSGVPEVVCAAPEDIADSAERLGDILSAIR